MSFAAKPHKAGRRTSLLRTFFSPSDPTPIAASPLPTLPPSTPNTSTANLATVPPTYRSYGYRWLILAIFAVTTAANAMLWTTFAPISDSSSLFFFPESTATQSFKINLVALMYQITYLPGTILASYLVRDGGLAAPIIAGSVLTAVGSVLRYIAVLLPISPNSTYYVVLLGQTMASFAQPCFVNSPGLLGANWFGVNERDIATTIASLFAIIGNAAGQIMPPAVVKTNTDTDPDGTTINSTVTGMEDLLLYQAIICTVCLVLVVLFFRSSPPTPPSSSTANRDKKNRVASTDLATTSTDPLLPTTRNSVGMGEKRESAYSVSAEARKLFASRDYTLLFLAFGLGLALFNTLLTLMNGILEPCGYSEDDAGNFAAVLIGAGMVGAGIAGYIMDTYHAYRPLLKCGFASAGFACCGLSYALKPDSSGLLYVCFGMLGFCMIPMLPVMIENSIECTYPVSEELSAGILFTAGNVIGIPITLLMQYLIDQEESCGGFFTPVKVLLMVTAFVCGGFALQYNGQYKRLEAEGLH